jgi:hypothetical protein
MLEVTPQLVRTLIEQQFPQWASLQIDVALQSTLEGSGWALWKALITLVDERQTRAATSAHGV